MTIKKRKALIVGIDDYADVPLKSCVRDAKKVNDLIQYHETGGKNFSTKLLVSHDQSINRANLLTHIKRLFSGSAGTLLFYFSGHAIVHQETEIGYLVTQDGERDNWGVSFSEVLNLANKSAEERKNTCIIILDCCTSGAFGNKGDGTGSEISMIGSGLTILTACDQDEIAKEKGDYGLFTTSLIDGLKGASADILGRVTPASIYAHVDQTLGDWEQRPVYKASVKEFISLREVSPKIPLNVLRKLTTYFPSSEDEFPLDPAFEPDREGTPARIAHIQPDPEKTAKFADLQKCNRHGLVEPVGEEHMYFAAINSKPCRLTALGKHYWNLVNLKEI